MALQNVKNMDSRIDESADVESNPECLERDFTEIAWDEYLLMFPIRVGPGDPDGTWAVSQ